MPQCCNTIHTLQYLQSTENTPLLESGFDTSSISTYCSDDERIRSSGGTASSATLSDSGDVESKFEKPMPKLQILLLCYARLMEPLAFFSIFPYIAEMVHRNGNVPVSHVGFYSGLIESLFSATQVVVLMLLGARANRLSRKKTLIVSLAGMSIGPALFGLSTSLWQMALLRSLTGGFSGANFIIRTMIGEHCSAKTVAKAFSWYSVAGNLGIFLGPIIGGALVDPATQYPLVFGGLAFFERHPYALPGFVIGILSATAAISSVLFLEETLRVDEPAKEGSFQSNVGVRNTNRQPTYSQLSVWQLLKSPSILAVFCVYGYVMILAIAFIALIPVMLYTPIKIGGLGCSPGEITIYMSAMGVSESLWLMFVFPPLHRCLGSKGMLRLCSFAWPLFFAVYPSVNALLRDGSRSGHIVAILVTAMNAMIGPGTWMSLTAAQLAINEVSPSPEILGKLNSMAEICSSLIRTFIPGISTAIFAVGVRGHILSGHLAWLILVLLGLGLAFTMRRVGSFPG
jgi:MFS family permease